jgi:DNA-binding NarL/FixJ family response regulator
MREAFGGPALPLLVPAERPRAVADLVDAHVAAGDLPGAHEVLAGAGSVATPWGAAVTARARATLLLAEGRAEQAAEAAAEAGGFGAPLASALAALLEGRARGAAGDRPRAIALLTEAEAALDGFGARRSRDEAVRELRALGRRVVRPAAPGGDGPLAGLTAREREIAELVADGRTNREVAEQLVLSAKTIEAHLRNIYAKLGIRSRVELTRAASRVPDR